MFGNQGMVRARWLPDIEGDAARTLHRNGVRWSEAAAPPARHWCRPQSIVRINGVPYERCPCGAWRSPFSRGWQERNWRTGPYVQEERPSAAWMAVLVGLGALLAMGLLAAAIVVVQR